MKYQIPLSPHPGLHSEPPPNEAEIIANIKHIQREQEQEIITSIFQHVRTNIAQCTDTPNPELYAAPERNRSIATMERSLHFRSPAKGQKPPTWKPKDLAESISSSTKRDATYYIHEAARQLKTRLRNPSEEERYYAGNQNSPEAGPETRAGDELQQKWEESNRVQKNILDISRDPRLQRR